MIVEKVYSLKFTVYTTLLFLLTVNCLLLTECYAQPISSSELINNAKTYDGKLVVYEGEVVGDVMCRGDFCWVNLNDGQNAVGIWVLKEATSKITYKGSYKEKGDWLRVSGIFHRACLEHGGDLDIHGQEIIKTSEGKINVEKLNLQKVKLLLVLSGVLLCLIILKILKFRQRKI